MMLLRSFSTPVLASLHGAHWATEKKPTTSSSVAFTSCIVSSLPRDAPSASSPQAADSIRRTRSTGTLNVTSVPNEEVGPDSPVKFRDGMFTRLSSKPTSKLESIPSFTLYNKDGIEGVDDDDDDGTEFSFTTVASQDPDVVEAKELGWLGLLGNLDRRWSSFQYASKHRSLWQNTSALYMATGLGIDGPPARTGLDEFDDERLQHHYEKLVKDNPCNPLILRNYARYLCKNTSDYMKAEEFYARAILAGPDDGEIMSEYASLIWEINRDKEKASDYFERALRLSPDNSYVLAAYASFLWESDTGMVEPDIKFQRQPCAKPQSAVP